MDDSQELLLDPQKQLLFAVSNAHNLLGSLSEEIETLSALVNDFGERMSSDIRERWKAKLAVSLQDCGLNRSGIPDEMQGLCMAALHAIEGRFYEVIEKNYESAGSCYERAAKVLASMPKPQLQKLMTCIIQGFLDNREEDLILGEKKVKLEESQLQLLGVALAFPYRLPEAGLWSNAGDTYCKVRDVASSRRCYDMGLKVSSEELAGEVEKPWAVALRQTNCRLSLSMAAAVLIPSDEWEQGQLLYRKAADSMFFNIDQKDNNVYRDICGILVHGSGASLTLIGFVEPDWFPRVPVSIVAEKDERLLRLKAELGQRALDTLRTEYEKSEEGFPVPETYFLVGILSEIYKKLQNYDGCINLISIGSHNFDDGFWEWTFDELTEAHDWSLSFVQYAENVSFVRGLLQRPDYKEFIERMKKAEESHQRLELRQIRFDRILERASSRASREEVRDRLAKENPWLEDAANRGSVENAESLYQQLKDTNWGEVVMGYWNAVEEELKFVYREYLAFKLAVGQSDKNYGKESQRQNKPGAVLDFIAGITTNRLENQIWGSFVQKRMPDHKDFLSNELPGSLSALKDLRNPSAHGKMPDRTRAERAREIVLGKHGQLGLLAKLVMLRKPNKQNS